jgi:hypothetical protein
VHEAVVAAHPDEALGQRRLGNREDRAVVLDPVLSPVIGPPDHFCFDLSLVVRSGLMAVQL